MGICSSTTMHRVLFIRYLIFCSVFVCIYFSPLIFSDFILFSHCSSYCIALLFGEINVFSTQHTLMLASLNHNFISTSVGTFIYYFAIQTGSFYLIFIAFHFLCTRFGARLFIFSCYSMMWGDVGQNMSECIVKSY